MAQVRTDLSVSTLDALATIHVAAHTDGSNAWVDAEGDYWALQKDSGAPIGVDVIAPLPGAPSAGSLLARWIRQAGGGGGGVVLVSVTAPLQNVGTLANPNIAISPATLLAAGSMSAADKAALNGLGVAESVPFTFGSGPMPLQAVLAGDLLDRASVLITTPFDGVGASLAMGTTTDPHLIFAPGDITPNVLATYDNSALEEFSVPDFLQLVINPGGSTQGAGRLFYTLRR